VKIGETEYVATLTVSKSPDILKGVKLAKNEKEAYYVVRYSAPVAARLALANITPYSCTCQDFVMRRMYAEGAAGNCKHITACLPMLADS
jgi:hypothetical protein